MQQEENCQRRRSIRGIVIPVAWDDHASVQAVSICTDDEEEYFVVDSEIVPSLIGCLRQLVCVEGTVFEDGGLRKEILVERFTLVRA